MTLNSASQIGKIIGNLSREQEYIKAQINPDDPSGLFNASFNEELVLEGTIVATKKTIKSDSFVIDHPIQSELDNASYILDGGYEEGELSFPVSFPVAFDTGGDEILYSGTL